MGTGRVMERLPGKWDIGGRVGMGRGIFGAEGCWVCVLRVSQ